MMNDTTDASLYENRLFEGLARGKIKALREQGFITYRDCRAGDVLIEEGANDSVVFLIVEGSVEIFRQRSSDVLSIAFLGPGEYFGEMSYLDGKERAASVRASSRTRLAALDLAAAELNDHAREGLVQQLRLSHAREQSRRLRAAHERSAELFEARLEQERARSQLSLTMIIIVVLSSLYTYSVGAINGFTGNVLLLVSLGVALCGAAGAVFFIRSSSMPARSFGITLDGERNAFVACLRWTFAACVLMTASKAVAVLLIPSWRGLPVIDLVPFRAGFTGKTVLVFLMWSAIYLVSCAIQELAVRSFMHTSFEFLLVGPRRQLWALLLSNLVFSSFHIHYNPAFAALTFVSGLLYGAFWMRHRNLLSTSLLHTLTAVWAQDALCLFGLPGLTVGG